MNNAADRVMTREEFEREGRDEIALRFALVITAPNDGDPPAQEWDHEVLMRSAYEMADAFIAERAKQRKRTESKS